ncbi:AAA family ATPase [Rhodobacterales bacterium LSUCC1028]|nr:AAA family ATPase [Rhodobacterales bacterium LSUCC1028]
MKLANAGLYDASGAQLTDLKNLNFIFGSNGSGKTTISRVIRDGGASSDYPDCQITWAGGAPLETHVYNKDFVDTHFNAESNIQGIYTFGGNVDVAEEIKKLKNEADGIKAKLSGLQRTLIGEDGTGGKKKEREDLAPQFLEYVWDAKRNFSDLKDAFTGLNSDKKKFRDRYLIEAESNVAKVRDIAELREDAATVFSRSLTEANVLPNQDSSKLLALESSAILNKKIIGKEDVDIAALIKKLGNSDWVQQGRQYFDQLRDQCPFCQQKTDEAFRQSLEGYFDESYVADLAAIDKLLVDYTDAAKELLNAYSVSDIVESPYLDREAFEKDVAALSLALDSNIDHIKAKRKEPSATANLTDTAPLLAAVNAHILTANKKVKVNNDTIKNLEDKKKDLTSQIWKRLLEDTKAVYHKFKTETGGLDQAINSLETQIEKETKSLNEKQEEIEENERKIASIKPTISAINDLLKSFGFTNFHLVESAESGFYEVKRRDGSDAKKTLSEGEKSFITFLYFYHLIGGSFNSSGGTNDRVVVFDDPVSSLDSDILFIVCSLIKKVVFEMRSGSSAVKQVFVLTHNIYFHKEVTLEKNVKKPMLPRKRPFGW